MKILICGHRSFLAQGLEEALVKNGHEVVCFTRGALGRQENVVTGPVDRMDENSELVGEFDTVVNYILLKDEEIAPNIVYIQSLLKFCAKAKVKHLIHLSSISSYKATVSVVDEHAEVETDPSKKGAYGAPKVATDQYLLNHTPANMKLTLLRPAFVLAPGLMSPIVGTAARLPWNKLLVIGAGQSRMPVTTRVLCNEAMVRLINHPPAEAREVVILVDPNSPTRVEYLQACCDGLGAGTGVVSLPPALWWCVAAGGEMVARLIGQGKLKPYQKLTARITTQRYDPARSAARLGMPLSVDWKGALVESMNGQQQNFSLPFKPANLGARLNVPQVTFLGFGRIVKQKHLPALKKLGFTGRISAYDVRVGVDEGVQVEDISQANPKDNGLYIVASPGPAHTAALGALKDAAGPVLVEKPLCYTPQELGRWNQFAASRQAGVYVCHNYRFKQNVVRMLEHLSRYNPGRLDHVSVHFQSPPVSNSSSAWMRNERVARTLLMDFGLHFLDLGCMFANSPWRIDNVRHQLNHLGQTSLIEGHLTANYSVSFLMRQGFAPRRARLLFAFENYSMSLGFFPDTFVAYHADDNPWLYKSEASDSRRKTFAKIIDKLTNRDSDMSHVHAIAAAGSQTSAAECMRVANLAPFYAAVFEIAQSVYG